MNGQSAGWLSAEGGKLEEALECYGKSLNFNPCDTVFHTDYIRDEKVYNELLQDLTPLVLGVVFAGLTPAKLRDPGHSWDIAAELRLDRAAPHAGTANPVISWALSHDDEALKAFVGSAGAGIPISLLRRFLSEVKTALMR